MTEPPKPVEAWRAWYPDEVYASNEIEWSDLPNEGVQVIVLFYDEWTADGQVRYRKLLDGDDYYWHVPGTDEFGSDMDPAEIPDNAIVKEGLEIPDERFDARKEQAVASTWP